MLSGLYIYIYKTGAYIYCNVYFFYITCRDGVSEGQFYQVLLFELDAIRKVKDFCLLVNV